MQDESLPGTTRGDPHGGRDHHFKRPPSHYTTIPRLGCRISEALGLKVEDIDLAHSTVTITHLKARLKLSCIGCGQRLGRNHTFCSKCGGKVKEAQAEQQQHRRQRVLPVDGETLKMLREYIERGGPVVRDGRRLIFGINRHRGWQIVKECA
ncbi:hypothetical protein ACFLXC_06605, partial [Chloroflexota bacterium]